MGAPIAPRLATPEQDTGAPVGSLGLPVHRAGSEYSQALRDRGQDPSPGTDPLTQGPQAVPWGLKVTSAGLLRA